MIDVVGLAFLGICYIALIASVVGRNPAIILLSITVMWLFLCQSPLYPVYFKILWGGRWFFLGASVIAFLIVGSHKGGRMRLSRIMLFPAAFGLYFYITQLWSIHPELTVGRSTSVLLLACVVISIVRYIGDSIPRRDLVLMAVIFPIPLVFWVLTFIYGFDLTYIERGQFRTSGPMLNPNGIGVLGALMAPVAYYLSKSRCDMRGYWRFCLLTFIFMLLISGSRGSMVAMVVAFIVIASSGAKKTRSTYFLVLSSLVVITVLLLLDSENIDNFFQTYLRKDSFKTGSGRLEAWGNALEILMTRPWIGYGFGVEDRIFEYFGIRFFEHSGAAVHNSYLGLGIQIGIPAALIFYISLFMITIKSYRLCLRYGNKEEIILVACAVSGLTLGVWESWLYSAGSPASLPFWIIFGVMVRSFGTKKVIFASRRTGQSRISGQAHDRRRVLR